MSKKTTTARGSSGKGSKTESSTLPQPSAISEHSLIKGTPEHIREWLKQSLEAHPVKVFPQPDSVRAKWMKEIYSPQPLKPFASWDPSTSIWKTYQGCFQFGEQTTGLIMDEYLENWPRAGLILDGVAYRLPNWERRIKEIGSGYLPTPTSAADAPNMGSNKKAFPRSLIEYARTWPTPTKANHRGHTQVAWDKTPGQTGGTTLPGAVLRGGTPTRRTWATPNCADGMGGPGNQGREGGENLRTQASGQLNPDWVEWLMGWPIGFTDLKPLAMDKFRSWQKQFGKS